MAENGNDLFKSYSLIPALTPE